MTDEVIYTEYGPISGDFKCAALGDLCVPGEGVQTGPFGSQLHASDYVFRGTPIITVEHLGDNRIVHSNVPRVCDEDKERLSKYILKKGDIVFSRVGSVDRRAIVRPEEDGWMFSGRCLRIRPHYRKIDSAYLSWFLGLPGFKEYIRKIAVGATMPSLNTKILHNVIVYFPPSLQEQRAIANIFNTLDDKIELNRQMNETLEAIARSIFKSWFVDFDPVRAKAEGRDPHLPKHIADLFPDRFEDSELGEIPAGWNVKKLSDLCSTQYGYTASAVDEPVGPKLLRVTDINKRNWIEWGDVPHCVIEPDARASYALQVGDLVVARMADPGKSAIIEEEIDAVFASYLVRLKTASLAHSYYIYGFLKSDLYAEYAEGAKSGSVQANMNAKVIVGTDLIVPPRMVMEQFLQAVFPLRQHLVANVRESRILAVLRDALLPKLISGEVRPKHAERHLGSAI